MDDRTGRSGQDFQAKWFATVHREEVCRESPNFLELTSSVEYCIETFAEKKVIVFKELHEACND